MRKISSELDGELGLLKAERRKIGETFGVEGNPVKRIQGLEKHIAHIQGELKGVFRRYGGYALEPALKKVFDPLLKEEDLLALDKMASMRELIRDAENQIEKLRASLAIDDERDSIAKAEKAIAGERQRIASAEKAIARYMVEIDESMARIKELSKDL
jgi:chromosome segregation ATPase